MLLFCMLLSFSELGNSPHESMSFSVLRIGSSALHHFLRAMYSDSVELSAISVLSFLDQCIGTPANTMINHVLDKHESRKCVNSGAILQQNRCCSMHPVIYFCFVS
jgi:hypothetical protein